LAATESPTFHLNTITEEYELSPFGKEDYPFRLVSQVHDKLYDYQRECLQWLWKLHCKPGPMSSPPIGGILGDDMGLGKTVQISAFIAGLFHSDIASRVLVLSPVSVLQHWQRELKRWCPQVEHFLFHGISAKKRSTIITNIARKGGVCISTYGMVKNNLSKFSFSNARADAIIESVTGRHSRKRTKWDYVVLDEGHCIKNPDIQLSVALRRVPARHRILLSGTPIQNNLMELWSLFDFVSKGTLLGDRKTFKLEFANKIVAGQDKHASEVRREIGNRTAESLRALIKPYFLRREKKGIRERDAAVQREIASSLTASDCDSDIKMPPTVPKPDMKARKNDFILWSYLSESQLRVYDAFLESQAVKDALNHTQSPLAAMTVLKKICDHPRLLSEEMKTCKELCLLNASFAFDALSLMQESGKLGVMMKILEDSRQNGHRTLIFSQSKKMLDIIEICIGSKGMTMCRIDGDVLHPQERQNRVDRFNNDSSIDCFLLTTQVGGLGLNLTGADRVVIFDPAWNPATDNQAVDRSYRIGQTRNVVVYRFVTCGTIEEVIYRKQVFKGVLSKTATEAVDVHRYFSHKELRQVFTLTNPRVSETQQLLEGLHSSHRVTDGELDNHVDFLQEQDIFGISDHDLLFVNARSIADMPDATEEITNEVQSATTRLLNSVQKKSRTRSRVDLTKTLQNSKQHHPSESDIDEDVMHGEQHLQDLQMVEEQCVDDGEEGYHGDDGEMEYQFGSPAAVAHDAEEELPETPEWNNDTLQTHDDDGDDGTRQECATPATPIWNDSKNDGTTAAPRIVSPIPSLTGAQYEDMCPDDTGDTPTVRICTPDIPTHSNFENALESSESDDDDDDDDDEFFTPEIAHTESKVHDLVDLMPQPVDSLVQLLDTAMDCHISGDVEAQLLQLLEAEALARKHPELLDQLPHDLHTVIQQLAIELNIAAICPHDKQVQV
jgi:SNF2-related domain/Helicase conserved C-terminal domain